MISVVGVVSTSAVGIVDVKGVKSGSHLWQPNHRHQHQIQTVRHGYADV